MKNCTSSQVVCESVRCAGFASRASWVVLIGGAINPLIALMVVLISPERSLVSDIGELIAAAFLLLQVLLLISNVVILFVLPRSGRLPIVVRCIVGAIINILVGTYLFFICVLRGWGLG